MKDPLFFPTIKPYIINSLKIFQAILELKLFKFFPQGQCYPIFLLATVRLGFSKGYTDSVVHLREMLSHEITQLCGWGWCHNQDQMQTIV